MTAPQRRIVPPTPPTAPPPANPTRSRPPASESLYAILDRLGVKQWDVVLVGDGSGSGWDIGCGWACVLIEKATRARHMLHGGMSVGTVNIAELMAYVHTMLWYASQHGKTAIRYNNGRPLDVHILTDSGTVVAQGRRLDGAATADGVANQALWSALMNIGRQGYNFHFHHINRLTNQLNWAADQMAGKSRLAVRTPALLGPDGEPIRLYDLNATV